MNSKSLTKFLSTENIVLENEYLSDYFFSNAKGTEISITNSVIEETTSLIRFPKVKIRKSKIIGSIDIANSESVRISKSVLHIKSYSVFKKINKLTIKDSVVFIELNNNYTNKFIYLFGIKKALFDNCIILISNTGRHSFVLDDETRLVEIRNCIVHSDTEKKLHIFATENGNCSKCNIKITNSIIGPTVDTTVIPMEKYDID